MKKLAYFVAVAMATSCVYMTTANAEQAAPTTKKAATDAAKNLTAAKGVRKPTSNVDKFWDDLKWDELSAEEQKIWGVLGWDSKSWNQLAPEPASDKTAWDKLSKEEQAAASSLGYDPKSWDE
ncbi:MAG: hypothetical protein QX190_12255 [Methylococcales bacterium]